MIFKKSNYQLALAALIEARGDHCDGVNAIYRLAACVPIPEKTSVDGLRRQIKSLSKQLSLLQVQANRILIHDNMLEIDFYPKGFQMVMSKGQYTGLLLEFAKFLDESNISDIKIQTGSYDDDPEISVRAASNDLINFFPTFDSKCFGMGAHNSSIEVVSCCSNKKYNEVA